MSIKDKTIKVVEGKVVIEDQEIIKSMMDQGMQFSDDGSLDLEEGQDGWSITFAKT